MNVYCLRFGVCLVAASYLAGSIALAHPNSTTAHEHSSSSIKWEIDPTKNGDNAHNHYKNRNYGFSAEFFELQSPWHVDACWDNQQHRRVGSGTNGLVDIAHCYIDEDASVILANSQPTYYFANSSSWPSSAKARVRDAFDKWSDVTSLAVDVGIKFVEVPSATGADIIIFWVNSIPGSVIQAPNAKGAFNFSTKEMYFRSSVNWSYSTSTSISSNQYHFYSVALHEIGHAVGLNETGNTGSVMFISGSTEIGAPGSSGRRFNSLKSADKEAVRDLYGIPNQPVAQVEPCRLQWEFLGCNGSAPMGAITATLPGYTVSNAQYLVSTNGGPWMEIFEGILSCIGLTPQLYMLARAILTTSQGVSECTISVPYPSCDDPIHPF